MATLNACLYCIIIHLFYTFKEMAYYSKVKIGLETKAHGMIKLFKVPL